MAQAMLSITPAERRITLRMLSYWERLRGVRPMPTEEDIDPDDLHDLWDSCFLLHVKDLDKPDYNYTYLGDDIAKTLHGETKPGTESGYNTEQIKYLIRNYAQVVDSGKPMLEEGEFKNTAQEVVKYRQCLLPLGEGGQVRAILGGVRFKVFS